MADLTDLRELPVVIVGLDALGTLVGYSRRTLERWEQRERLTGLRHLPRSIPGMPHRWRREDVRRWLATGVPTASDRSAA
jgi:hypothetical protein